MKVKHGIFVAIVAVGTLCPVYIFPMFAKVRPSSSLIILLQRKSLQNRSFFFSLDEREMSEKEMQSYYKALEKYETSKKKKEEQQQVESTDFTFFVKKRKSRTGINSVPCKTMTIPAKKIKKLKFKLGNGQSITVGE